MTTPSVAGSPAERIVAVQHLRALAVLMVVIGHLHQTSGRILGFSWLGDGAFFGFLGVDVFFVISGFIIHHLYRHHDGLDLRFFLNRLNRIYPMYWVITGVAAVGYVIFFRGDLLTALADGRWLTTLFLWPTGHLPLLSVGWTLVHELWFYLAYGVFLAIPARFRIFAVASWLVVSLVGLAGLTDGLPAWLRLIASPFNLLFLAGALIAQFRDQLDRLLPVSTALAIGGAAFGVFWTLTRGLDGLTDPAVRVVVALPFAVGIVGSLLAWRPVLPALAARLGDWSYVAYLSHALALDILARLALRLPLADGGQALALGGVGLIAIPVLAWMLHRLLERPLLSLGRQAIAEISRKPV
ncbi:acyltransferase [Maricaulis sp.]|uniref:acyltransferase family protein n=1 Tax=Maricaulis sp. TaxID=1486257 RepID=UPI0025C169D9|nr:acyltransferase [Maricaulis sp.]